MAKRKTLRRIKTKVGVDPVLERAADKILKQDRIKTKRETRRADAERLRAERLSALDNPTETMKEIRKERAKKRIAKDLKERLLRARTDREVSRATDEALPAETKLTAREKLRMGREYVKYRKRAKRLGQEAAVKAAQSGTTHKKQFLVSSSAKALNASAEKIRREVQDKRWSAARELEQTASPRKFKKMTGMRKNNVVRRTSIARALEERGYLPELAPMRKKVELLKGLSKDQARISGGLSTASDRQAMAALRRTQAGKRAKSMARSAGYRVGLAGFLATAAGHLMGNSKEKKRG